jgi:membrane protein required for beta-lactamase induction
MWLGECGTAAQEMQGRSGRRGRYTLPDLQHKKTLLWVALLNIDNSGCSVLFWWLLASIFGCWLLVVYLLCFLCSGGHGGVNRIVEAMMAIPRIRNKRG